MNFGFTDEQEMLRDQVRRFMQEACNLPRVRQVMQTETGFDPALWRQMADLGWLGLTLPAESGGLGLKWVDLTVVLEETGRGLSPLPLLSHTLAGTAIRLAGSPAQQTAWLPDLATGSTVWTLALYDEPNWIDAAAITLTATPCTGGVQLDGTRAFVSDAGAATHFLLACRMQDSLALVVVHRNECTVRMQPTIDRTRPTGSVTLDRLVLGTDRILPLSLPTLERLNDLGAVGVTAEMVGAAEAALTMTSDYARTRVQFGKPIGQYQGVKHRLADMYVDTESFKSLLYYAAWCVDDAPAELPRAVSLAKGYAADAFARIGIDAVGLHGAIGFTAEYDVQLYLKRSKWARPMFGDSDWHLDRVATLGGL